MNPSEKDIKYLEDEARTVTKWTYSIIGDLVDLFEDVSKDLEYASTKPLEDAFDNVDIDDLTDMLLPMAPPITRFLTPLHSLAHEMGDDNPDGNPISREEEAAILAFFMSRINNSVFQTGNRPMDDDDTSSVASFHSLSSMASSVPSTLLESQSKYNVDVDDSSPTPMGAVHSNSIDLLSITSEYNMDEVESPKTPGVEDVMKCSKTLIRPGKK